MTFINCEEASRRRLTRTAGAWSAARAFSFCLLPSPAWLMTTESAVCPPLSLISPAIELDLPRTETSKPF